MVDHHIQLVVTGCYETTVMCQEGKNSSQEGMCPSSPMSVGRQVLKVESRRILIIQKMRGRTAQESHKLNFIQLEYFVQC